MAPGLDKKGNPTYTQKFYMQGPIQQYNPTAPETE